MVAVQICCNLFQGQSKHEHKIRFSNLNILFLLCVVLCFSLGFFFFMICNPKLLRFVHKLMSLSS